MKPRRGGLKLRSMNTEIRAWSTNSGRTACGAVRVVVGEGLPYGAVSVGNIAQNRTSP